MLKCSIDQVKQNPDSMEGLRPPAPPYRPLCLLQTHPDVLHAELPFTPDQGAGLFAQN